MDVDLIFEPTRSSSRRHGCAGTCTTGEGFPGSALEDPQTGVTSIDHLQKSDVRSSRESWMRFERRTEHRDRGVIDIVDSQDDVRITHRNFGERDFLTFYIELRGAFARKLRNTHVDRDHARFTETRFDSPAETVENESSLENVGRESSGESQPLGDAAYAVSALLHFAAVGIEYPVERNGARLTGRQDHECLVEADSGMSVSQLAPHASIRKRIIMMRLDDHEVVSEAMHFGEPKRHERAPRSTHRRAITEDAAIHHGEEACVARTTCGNLVDDAILQPQRWKFQTDAVVDDGGDVLGSAEDIDEID